MSLSVNMNVKRQNQNSKKNGSDASGHAPLCAEIATYFFYKKTFFLTSNSFCYNFHGDKVNGNAATFSYESLYVLLNAKTVSFNPASSFDLLLLLSGDIEVCPGASRIPERFQSYKNC